MTVDEARQAVYRHARLRFPNCKDMSVGEKIDGLEGYITDLAIARGELEEARLYVSESLAELMAQWDDIEGWETLLPTRYTQDDIRRAKKRLRPELAAGIHQGRQLVARLSEQIRRLEQDEKMASRQYTVITGNS